MNGRKHNAITVHLKDQACRQSLFGESSATNISSGSSKFATSVTDLCKTFMSTHKNVKINNPKVSNFFLKYPQTHLMSQLSGKSIYQSAMKKQ
jgi:hypothetical protein